MEAAFNPLEYSRVLKEAGVPEEQAEAQAQFWARTFVTNMDNLVTKEYLDARFREQDARIDARFVQQDAKLDSRFNALASDMLVMKWMLALVVAALVLPALTGLLG